MQKTAQNLAKAFIGESQARNRYTFYAKIAQDEGYEQIAEVFLLTAEQEKAHAKKLFSHLQKLKKSGALAPEAITVEASASTDLGATAENLASAVAGETYEFTEMYPEFSKVAAAEGLNEIAANLKAIAKAEEHHQERYSKLVTALKAGTVFKKGEGAWWVCRKCGHAHFGNEAPKICPACSHPQAYYQIKSEEY